MRKEVLIIILTCFWLGSSAQDETSKFQFGSMQQLGVIVEANRVRAMPSLINGVRYDNKWFAGVGIAYEINPNNGWGWGLPAANTMPLYLDIRHYFFKKKWVFALADVGANFVVGNDWMIDNENNRYEKFTGYYGNVGCGIKSRLGRKVFYSFDVSYNFKQTRYNQDTQNWQGQWTETDNNFKQRRILVRLGLEI